MNVDELTGRTVCHLAEFQPHILLHKEVIIPFLCLKKRAAEAGFCLEIVSGFRSFDRQLAIWNKKVAGERAVLDEQGKAIPHGTLQDEALMWAILRWSALPGTSRHHWGTDIDIWDSTAVSADYSIQLIDSEYQTDGPFGPMMTWLAEQMDCGATEFYRPYNVYDGGVMPEPWHLSYRPVAQQLKRQLTVDSIVEIISQSNIGLKCAILDNITEIMDRFVVE